MAGYPDDDRSCDFARAAVLYRPELRGEVFDMERSDEGAGSGARLAPAELAG